MSCDVVTVDNCSTRHGTTVTTHDNTNLIDVPQNVSKCVARGAAHGIGLPFMSL